MALLALSPTYGFADNVLHPATPSLDRPTIMTLGVKLPVTGDDNYNAKVSVRYHASAGGTWRDAQPLYRVHPETVFAYSITPQFAGSIFDLRPGTTYTIELHVTDPDGAVDQTFTLTATTRAVPSGPATPRARPVSTAAELRAALGNAVAGDVITLADGTYSGSFSVSASGNAANPIVIRGASRDGAILDGGNCNCDIFSIYGSYTHLKNLTLRGGARAVSFNSGLTGNVVRFVHTVNTRLGITSGNNEQDFYIADNVLEGRLAWPLVYKSDGGAHSDDDGIRMSGFGMVIAHNQISGFGDAIKNNHWGARSLDVYGNDVLWSYDNGLELDVSEGNVRALRNRFTNCSTPLSVQPVFAGPAYIMRNVVTNTVDEQVKFHALNIASPPPQPNGVFVYHNTFVSAENELQVQTPYASYYTTLENNLFIAPSPLGAYPVNWDAPLYHALFDYNGYYPDGHFLFRWGHELLRTTLTSPQMQAAGVETSRRADVPGTLRQRPDGGSPVVGVEAAARRYAVDR